MLIFDLYFNMSYFKGCFRTFSSNQGDFRLKKAKKAAFRLKAAT